MMIMAILNEHRCDPGERLTLAGKQTKGIKIALEREAGKQGLDGRFTRRAGHQNNNPSPKQEAPCNSEDATIMMI